MEKLDILRKKALPFCTYILPTLKLENFLTDTKSMHSWEIFHTKAKKEIQRGLPYPPSSLTSLQSSSQHNVFDNLGDILFGILSIFVLQTRFVELQPFTLNTTAHVLLTFRDHRGRWSLLDARRTIHGQDLERKHRMKQSHVRYK